jgi:chromosome segregation ATPase
VRVRISWACLAACVVAALPAAGADLDRLEHAVLEAAVERDRAREERGRRMSEAGPLADEIARLKEAHTGPHADLRLEAALKRFDRLALDLDGLDRTISDRQRRVAALRRRFDEEASREAARLASQPSGRIGEVARQQAAVDEARRRVARLSAGETAIRPALTIELSPSDGPLEIAQKLALAEAERGRLAAESARLGTDTAVIEARLLIKRQLLSELEGAARAGGSELALLRREADNAAQAIQDLSQEQERIGRQKAEVRESLAALDRRISEFRRRLAARTGRGERP